MSDMTDIAGDQPPWQRASREVNARQPDPASRSHRGQQLHAQGAFDDEPAPWLETGLDHANFGRLERVLVSVPNLEVHPEVEKSSRESDEDISPPRGHSG